MKLAALVVVVSNLASAAPNVVAIAGAPASPVVIDQAGGVFARSGSGAFVSLADGGIAGDVVAASSDGSAIFVGVAGAPPFERLDKTGWSVMNLGLRAVALLGRGERATAAVGKAAFELERGKATKLADAPAAIELLGASDRQLTVQTDHGLARWDGGRWTPLVKAPAKVGALLDARWALVDRGVLDVDTGAVVAWPLGFHPQAAVALGAVVYAASARELATVKRGAIAREPLPALASPIVGIVADRAGHIAIATRGGQLAQKLAGAWTVGELQSAPAVAHPGAPPAESK